MYPEEEDYVASEVNDDGRGTSMAPVRVYARGRARSIISIRKKVVA